MDYNSETYWEKSWSEENIPELFDYLAKYNKWQFEEMEIFKRYGLKKVCDAACGFGAYSLAFSSNGFDTFGFDISAKAVEIAKQGLKNYGIDTSRYKIASIIDTGYEDETFDGVIAHAVIDHLPAELAQKAVCELLRITVRGGLLLLSFDAAEQSDYEAEHIVLEDGSMKYTEESRNGMIFCPYDWTKIDLLLKGCKIVSRRVNQKNEKLVVVEKQEVKGILLSGKE